MKKALPIIIIALIIVGLGVVWKLTEKEVPEPVATKANLIRVYSPHPGQSVKSPLVIKGEARGQWFFEATFPFELTDGNGQIITRSFATAKGEWMTKEFVPFEATLIFTIDKNIYGKKGTLILRKSNASGLPEHDDALEIPVVFAGVLVSTPPPKICTQEAKLCPNGSYVGRTGPNCEFKACPLAGSSCKKDSDCPSSQYLCQEIQGSSTACPSTDPSCVPTHTIIAGVCKLKVGNRCGSDLDCASGNLCHKNICTSPIGKQCNGPSDTSCPTDFECIQGCGPPVAREGDLPPPYFCQLKGYIRACPICLAKNTLIDTPLGIVRVQDLQTGAPIWTVDLFGKRVSGIVINTSKTHAPPNHRMVELVLADGRSLLVSPRHPTIDGRVVGDLSPGDLYDGAIVTSANRVAYNDEFTYDILPSGDTGFYFANGILLGSTLR